MSSTTRSGNQYTYCANEHDTVLSEVSAVHCVLLPRAILVAGFNSDMQLVMAHYNCAARQTDAWSCDFFEHDFINEKLLGVPQQVRSIFIVSEDELIIPKELFDEKTARSWLKKLKHTAPDDVVLNYLLKSANAQYVFSLPKDMDKLLHRYFGQTKILPAIAYQFYKPAPHIPFLLQCLITEDTVVATLHKSAEFYWQGQFGYATVEDIAFQIANLCSEMAIPKMDLQLECGILCEDCYDLALELERYYPKIYWTSDTKDVEQKWSPMVYLAQQLQLCAL